MPSVEAKLKFSKVSFHHCVLHKQPFSQRFKSVSYCTLPPAAVVIPKGVIGLRFGVATQGTLAVRVCLRSKLLLTLGL